MTHDDNKQKVLGAPLGPPGGYAQARLVGFYEYLPGLPLHGFFVLIYLHNYRDKSEALHKMNKTKVVSLAELAQTLVMDESQVQRLARVQKVTLGNTLRNSLAIAYADC